METIAKKHYREYQASNEILRPHYFLADTILGYNPKSVFEFGCGTGKNLKLLMTRDPKLVLHGVDISWRNIEYAHQKNNLFCCYLGDEESLQRFADKSVDVIFTCSVLDHIHKIDGIIQEFDRIAKKAIVLFETNDVIDEFYYPHAYESLGFRKTTYSYVSNEAVDGDGANYGIWIKGRISQS